MNAELFGNHITLLLFAMNILFCVRDQDISRLHASYLSH
jgi:hypothetical protein